MLKETKIWIIVASLLMVIGTALFVAAMTLNGWNFTKLSTRPYITKSHDITDTFNNIAINTNTAKIVFVPSEDGVCRVTCTDDEHISYEVVVRDGTLCIDPMYKKKAWYRYIAISFGQSKITVELPEAAYGALIIQKDTGRVEIPADFVFESLDVKTNTGDISILATVSGSLKIHTDTGDIWLEGGTPTSMDLSVSTGDIRASRIACSGDVVIKVRTGKAYLTDLTCKNLTTTGSTGDLTLKNVIAEQAFSITRSTGDVTLEASDAAEIFIETDTGDVKGTLLSPKIFLPKTSTGKIRVPTTTGGGRCEITTSTGNIRIEIAQLT